MANEVFIDTGAFFALIDRRDRNHKAVLNTIDRVKNPLVTTNFVVDELITLLIARGLNFSTFEGMVDDLIAGQLCRVERVDSVVEKAAWHFLKKHSDHRFSFTDCTSFVTMKSLGINEVIAFDHHFRIAGFEVLG